MKTFLFYDIETTGLSSTFDQILTFAAIRTDSNFSEIHRKYITINLRNDIIPSPGAFITHRLSSQELSSGICEYKAAQKIHKIMNEPKTINIGYNNLEFDDEFLRFTFYRNLLDSYTHQYANKCSRMDLLPIATLYKIFKPEIIKWPEINGKPSMKLEYINKENSLVSSGRAHHAMTDVEATLELTKRLSKEKKMWDYSLDFFNKKKDLQRIKKIEKKFQTDYLDYRICIMVSTAFGAENMYMAPVMNIGNSRKYLNQSLWLKLDTKNLIPLKSDYKKDELFVIRKRYGETKIILPPLERFWKLLSKKQIKIYQENLDSIIKRADIFEEIVHYHQAYKYPFVQDLDPDASLYQAGFFSNQEKKDIALFYDAETENKILLSTTIKSPRLKSLLKRIVFRNFSDIISNSLLEEEYNNHIKKIISSNPENSIKGYKNDLKFTPKDGLEELYKNKKETQLDAEQHKILNWIESYIKNLIGIC